MTNLRPCQRFTVRKQVSGYSASVTYYIYDRQRRSRLDGWPHRLREDAQAEADDLNVGAMVRDYDDDPRPYEVRRAEARERYAALVKS